MAKGKYKHAYKNSHVFHLHVIYQKELRELLNPSKIGTRHTKKQENLVENVVK